MKWLDKNWLKEFLHKQAFTYSVHTALFVCVQSEITIYWVVLAKVVASRVGATFPQDDDFNLRKRGKVLNDKDDK